MSEKKIAAKKTGRTASVKSTGSNSGKRDLTAQQKSELLTTLESRFVANLHRHKDVAWSDVRARLETSPSALWSLHEMERSEGEPDVVGRDEKTGGFVFFDCSPQTPKGRVSVCYDRAALNERKEYKPDNSAADMAAAMGIQMLTEEQYFELQKLGDFDTTTSSWLKTPDEIRDQGGALFGDRRYGRVFVYQNGASSYYRVRGFRGCLKI